MRILFFYLLAFISCQVFGQVDTVFVFDAQKTKLVSIVDGKIISPFSNTILYSVKGNLVFQGESNEKEDILYMVDAKDLFERSKSKILSEDSDSVIATIKKGRVYMGDSDAFNEAELMAYILKSDQIIQFKDHKNDLIGYTNSSRLNSAEIFMAFKFLSNRYSLGVITQARMDSIMGKSYTGEVIGGMRARWSGGPGSEWVWDGQVFRPRNMPDIYFEWTYDGEIVKPRWQHDIYEEWTWDGTSIKPLWAQSPEYEYVWNGRLLKPYWPGDGRMEYVIEDGKAAPYLGSPRGEEWTIYGDVPMPLVIIVLLGISYR